LTAKKAAGAKLGDRTNLSEAQAKNAAANKAGADAFAGNVQPIIRQVEAAGAKGYRAIVAELNARRTVSVVVALPCRTWPIALPSTPARRLHHQSLGLNT